jgi:hypothetical protein
LAGIPEGYLAKAPTFSAFLQSLESVVPSQAPQRPAPLMDFLLPSARVRFEGPLYRRGSTPAFVPPSGFDYPLDGLLPSRPSEPYFMLTAPMGFAPSKHLFPRGVVVFPLQLTHMPFPLRLIHRSEDRIRRRRPRLLGLSPRGQRWCYPASSLGVLLSRAYRSLILTLPSEGLLSCA